MILLDVTMPGMDGPTTMTKLRQEPALASIPVIFITARVQTHEVASYMALGAAGVISKPFDVIELPGEIRRMTEAALRHSLGPRARGAARLPSGPAAPDRPVAEYRS